MIRVSEELRCPICDHADWCLISIDGNVAICPRTPSNKRIGEAGWLHILKRGYKTKIKDYQKKRKVPINWNILNEFYQKNLVDKKIYYKPKILRKTWLKFGVGFNGKSLTFPLYNADFEIIGIQRIFENGDKRYISGSKNGLFVPEDFKTERDFLVCEGLSDAAAAYQLGFNVVGRASCTSGSEHLIKLVFGFPRRPAVLVVADGDEPGKRGANDLVKKILEKAGKDLNKPLVISVLICEGDLYSDMVSYGKEKIKKWLKSCMADPSYSIPI